MGAARLAFTPDSHHRHCALFGCDSTARLRVAAEIGAACEEVGFFTSETTASRRR